MIADFFRDRSGYLWELIEGARFEEGAYVKCVDGPGDTYPDGVQLLVHFDPEGPVQIGVQNRRPSREFYVRRRAGADNARIAAEAGRTIVQTEIDRVDALDAAATTVAAIKALYNPEGDPDPDTGAPAPTPYEKRANAIAMRTVFNQTIGQTERDIVGLDERIAALDSLGRDFVPIPEVETEVTRMRP